jgi:Major Facilitator Superfamily
MAPIALAFAVLEIGSTTDLGIVLAAAWVPQIAFILVGGVWADRVSRSILMVGANALSGIAQGVVAVLFLTGHAQLTNLVALQICRGIATSFFFPASQGIVPQIVDSAEIQPANALLRLSQTGTSIVGASVGGALVATIGSGWAIAFDSATYFASALVLSRMHLPGRVATAARSFARELAEGWHEFSSRTWLWLIVVTAGVTNCVWVGGQAVLGPVVAKEHLHGAAGWGIVVAAESLGLVAAGLLALRWRPQRALLVGCLSSFPMPILMASLAVPFPFPGVVGAAILAGFGLELFNVLWITVIQQRIPDDVLARVNSYDALGSFVFIPLGLTIAGPIAASVGTSTALWGATCVTLVTVLTPLLSRDVRTLRRLDAPVELPPRESEPTVPSAATR